MASAPTPAPAEPQRMGALARMFSALVNPKAAFGDIARNSGMAGSPVWLVPLSLLIVLSLVITFSIGQRVTWQRVVAQQIDQSSRASQMSPEQRQQAVERGAKFAPIFGYVFGALGYPIIVVLMAAILMAAFNVLASAGVRFSAAMGIVAHACMPLMVSGLLAVVVIFLKDPENINLNNLLGSNLGALVASDSPKWLERLAISVDLFSFWVIFLLALGFSAVNPNKVSLGKGLGIVFSMWALLTLARVGLTAIFS